MYGFWQLLPKELRQRRTNVKLRDMTVMLALVALVLSVGVWPWETLMAAVAGILIFLPFWTVGYGIEAFASEWKGGHNQLLLSLPLSGAVIAGAKLAAGFLEGLGLLAAGKIILIAAAYLFLDWSSFAQQAAAQGLALDIAGLTSSFGGLAIIAGGFVFCMIAVSQFAWVVGALVPHRHFLVGLAAWFTGSWLVLRTASLGQGFLTELPRAEWWMVTQVRQLMSGEVAIQHLLVSVQPGALILMLAPACLLFAVTAHLLQDHIEV